MQASGSGMYNAAKPTQGAVLRPTGSKMMFCVGTCES